MRDVGFLVWIVLLVIGVIGSIVSSARKQAQRAPRPMQRPPSVPAAGPRSMAAAAIAPGSLPPWVERMIQVETPATPVPPPRPQPVEVKAAPRSTAPAAPVEDGFPMPHSVRLRSKRKLFGDRRDLVHAVIAAEVLGKPRGLTDEYRQY